MQENHDFYGYEVQSNGVTLEWTDQRQEADKAFDKCRSSAKLFKHNGQTKTVIAIKTNKPAKLRDLIQMHTLNF